MWNRKINCNFAKNFTSYKTLQKKFNDLLPEATAERAQLIEEIFDGAKGFAVNGAISSSAMVVEESSETEEVVEEQAENVEETSEE